MSCENCKDKMIGLENAKIMAKKIAIEKKQAQAICKEADGTVFTVDAARAFQEHFHIIDVVSGLATGT
jgi:hypothetical protein